MRDNAEVVIVRREVHSKQVRERVIWSNFRVRKEKKPFRLVLDERGNLNVLDARDWVAWSSNANLDTGHSYSATFSDSSGELVVTRNGHKVWSSAWSADQVRSARTHALSPSGEKPLFLSDVVPQKKPRLLIGNPVGNGDILVVEKFVKACLHPV